MTSIGAIPSSPYVTGPTAPTSLEGTGAATSLQPGGLYGDQYLNPTAGAGSIGLSPNILPAPVSPLDVLKGVDRGDLNLAIPLREGPLPGSPVPVGIKPGTTLRVSAHVQNGQLDSSTFTFQFEPPLDGPLPFMKIHGAKLGSDNRLTLDGDGIPPIEIGPPLSPRMADLAESLKDIVDNQGADVSFMGVPIPFAKIGMDPTSASAADLPGTRISLTNVGFNQMPVSLGMGGSVQFDPNSNLSLTGTPMDLRLQGQVGLNNLQLDSGGIKIAGGAGSGVMDVRYQSDLSNQATVTANISQLNLSAQSASAVGDNGDHLQLANAKLQKGNLYTVQTMMVDPSTGFGDPQTAQTQDAQFGASHFEGNILGGRFSPADPGSSGHIDVAPNSWASGSLEVGPHRIAFDGDISGQAHAEGIVSRVGSSVVNIPNADIAGSTHAHLDTAQPLTTGVSRANLDLNVQGGAQIGGVGVFPVTLGSDSQATVNVRNLNASMGQLPHADAARVQVNADIQGPITRDIQFTRGDDPSKFTTPPTLPPPPATTAYGVATPAVATAYGSMGVTTPGVPFPGSVPMPAPAPVTGFPAAPTSSAALFQTLLQAYPPLQFGDQGPLVQELQQLLLANGYNNLLGTGLFDNPTQLAVNAYQLTQNLAERGYVGQQTWSSLLGLGLSLIPGVNLLAPRP